MKKKRTLLVTGGMVCMMIAFSAAMPLRDDFKNLQVLPKDISAAELDKVMDSFNRGLGVKCNYCHAKNADTKELEFEKDTKPEKLMARKMMLMTNDLNQKYFNENSAVKAVTCFTCHHGEPIPPAVAKEVPKGQFF